METTLFKHLQGDHEHCVALMELLRIAKAEQDLYKHKEHVENFLMKFDTDINEHFKVEENILLPALARYMDIETEPFKTMLFQHISIRRFALELRDLINQGQRTDSLIDQIIEVMELHIDLEENHIIPKIKEVV